METEQPLSIGTRRELFVDYYWIDSLDGCRLVMQEPRNEGKVLGYDQPWEGVHSGCEAVMKVDDEFRLYYRGMGNVKDGDESECTCLATSPDGHNWTRPNIGQFTVHGCEHNNAVMAHQSPMSHNFMPFVDARPGVPGDERFKAVAGISRAGGLHAFGSEDGVHWRKLKQEPIITHESFAFDSANLAFWSDPEGAYVCYFRTWKDGIRWVSRALSRDFLNWSPTQEMVFRHASGRAPAEEIYTTATQPYFRAPHIYIALPRRFMKQRTILGDSEAEALGVVGPQRDSCSDTLLLSSRGGNVYDRTFLDAFMRPGGDRLNWSSRAGTVGSGIVQTGQREMSLYRSEYYGSPSAHLKRYSLRLDGFTSLRAGYTGGRMQTRPLKFAGQTLLLNYATSAAGHVRVEIQYPDGEAIPGFAFADCVPLIGDEIDRTVTWRERDTIKALVDHPVRFLFELKDADVFSFQTSS